MQKKGDDASYQQRPGRIGRAAGNQRLLALPRHGQSHFFRAVNHTTRRGRFYLLFPSRAGGLERMAHAAWRARANFGIGRNQLILIGLLNSWVCFVISSPWLPPLPDRAESPSFQPRRQREKGRQPPRVSVLHLPQPLRIPAQPFVYSRHRSEPNLKLRSSAVCRRIRGGRSKAGRQESRLSTTRAASRRGLPPRAGRPGF